MIQKRCVAVVGTGSVGVAAAYAMFLRRTASEILLVDKDASLAEGHAMDLMHGQALVGNIEVRAVPIAETRRAQVVVVAAGRSQKPGETRLELTRGNAAVVRGIVEALDEHAPQAVVLVATNPVDVLTLLAARASTRAPGRVVGTGTTLDSARFRALLGSAFEVSPRSVHAYVLGEHGDSQVPIWSQAAVGGLRLDDGPIRGVTLDPVARGRIAEATRDAARHIIARKGRTDLAIGTVIAHLTEAILHDERAVYPLSVPLDGEYGLNGVALSLPCVLGHEGVTARLTPPLTPTETTALCRSAEVLAEAQRLA